MNWKEQFEQRWQQHFQGSDIQYADPIITDYISTEIIEKLIEDIPDDISLEWKTYKDRPTQNINGIKLRRQLKDKWL